jgi:hypothetical protein
MKRASTILGLVVLFLVLLACKKGEGGKCSFNKECKDNLVCSFDTSECMTLDKANDYCKGTALCKSSGMCTISSVAAEDVGSCVAKSDDDCRQAECAKTRNCKYDSSSHSCN